MESERHGQDPEQGGKPADGGQNGDNQILISVDKRIFIQMNKR